MNVKSIKLKRMIKFVKAMKFIIACSTSDTFGVKFVRVNGSRSFTIPEAHKAIQDNMRMIHDLQTPHR